MSRWLARFSQKSTSKPPDKADTLVTMSGVSGINPGQPDSLKASTRHQFQERAAIREFDGNQYRVEAELGALVEVMPSLENINGRERLVIPHDAPLKYRWWQCGQELEATLRELGASDDTIRRYVGEHVNQLPQIQEGHK